MGDTGGGWWDGPSREEDWGLKGVLNGGGGGGWS